MNQRFYQLFEKYKKKIRYPAKIFYIVKSHTAKQITFEHKTKLVKSELQLEEVLYELCKNPDVYFENESQEILKEILKRK